MKLIDICKVFDINKTGKINFSHFTNILIYNLNLDKFKSEKIESIL